MIFKDRWKNRILRRGILVCLFCTVLASVYLTGCGQSGAEAKAAISGYKGELEEAEKAEKEAQEKAKKDAKEKAEAEAKEKAEAEAKRAAEEEAAKKDAEMSASSAETEEESAVEGTDEGTANAEDALADSDANAQPEEIGALGGNAAGVDNPSLNPIGTVPYVPCTFSKIGQSFDTYHIAGGDGYDPGALFTYMYGRYALNSGAAADSVAPDYNGYFSRVGVKNNRIIYDVQESGILAATALPSLLTSAEPLIVYGVDANQNVVELQAIWRGNNGYFIAFTEARHYPTGSYKDEVLKYTISTVNLNYVTRIPREVLSTNSEF